MSRGKKCTDSGTIKRKREIKYGDALGVAREEAGRGVAGDYIRPFSIKKGDRVLLCCRVSKEGERHHLGDQEASLRKRVEAEGGEAVGAFLAIANGANPQWIKGPVRMAKERGATILLAETTDRLVRHPLYHPDGGQHFQARREDIERLIAMTGDLILMTLHDPNSSPGEVRSAHTKRGQQASPNRPGRPPKLSRAERKAKYLPLVLKWRKRGKSPRKIAIRLKRKYRVSISHTAIRNWEREAQHQIG